MYLTTIINLWAGPGAGKSTTAAEVFARLKKAGYIVELVREYVKDWAWQGRTPGPWDDVYLTAKQLQAESILYGKVDYIVTDSPVGLGCAYATGPQVETQKALAKSIRARQHAAGIRHVDCFLKRTKPYAAAGRFETEEQAQQRDKDAKWWLSCLAREWRVVVNADDVLAAAGIEGA